MDENAGLAASLALVEATGRDCPVVFAVREQRSGPAALAGQAEEERLRVFGVLDSALTPELLVGGTNEVLARATHEHYLAAERGRGVTAADNPSLRPWERLPESLRESNRRFAEGIAAKLQLAGCVAVPRPLVALNGVPFEFDPKQVEPLARLEHERWMEDLQRDNWTAGPEKDPERLTHPNLVPWDQLTEADRDKDREAVRAIPAVLARAGFEVVRVAR